MKKRKASNMGIIVDKKGKIAIGKGKKECWESDLDIIKECGKKPQSIKIYILPLAKVKIDYLMSKFPNTEWLAYLVGDKKNYTVQDIIIPKQVVSSGSVTNVDSSICDNTVIGVIHSHHTMGSFFSKVDDDWINLNNDISLCISNNTIQGQVRWTTPCGSLTYVNAVAELKLDVDFDSKKFDEEIDKTIKKYTHNNVRRNLSLSPAKTCLYDDSEEDDDDDGSSFITKVTCFQDDNNTLEDELRLMEESEMFDNEVDVYNL